MLELAVADAPCHRSRADAEIAILEIAAQAPALELSIARMRHVEAGHGAFILG
jgi:hypothetical protein